jgi:preprotein translocase subunit YajC
VRQPGGVGAIRVLDRPRDRREGFIVDGLTRLLVLAQDAADGAAPEGAPGAPVNPLIAMLIYFGPILLIMIWMSSRQNAREQSRQSTLIKSLKKNDSVVTSSGILGHVVSVSEDGSEVTLRMVDDTRIKFRSDAIRGVLTKPEADPPKNS